MRGLRKRRRIQLVAIAAACLAVSAALIGYAMRDGIAYFRSPSEIAADPPGPDEVFRIGGLVEAGSIRKESGGLVRFKTTDGAASVETEFTGLLPDLFSEGQGVVALGSYAGGVFRATEILAKHDENYMPREVVDALKEQGLFRPADSQ